MIIIFFSVVFILFGANNLLAQPTFKCDKREADTETKKQPAQVKTNEWKKLKIKNFSFLVPKNFSLTKKQGVELPYWEYENENIIFTVYTSKRFPLPSIVERDLPTFSEESTVINNLNATLWFYKYETPVFSAGSEVFKFPFVRAAYFDNEQSIIAMYLKLKNECSIEIADKIFQSVELTKNKD